MSRLLFALLAVAALAGPAAAQRPKVKIDDARVGLPAGGGSVGDRDLAGRANPIAKRNTWAPVYVRLEMLGEYAGGANLKVETTDGDDLKTSLVVPLLPSLADRKPGEKIEPAELPYLPYARVGDRIGEVTLTVLTAPTDGSRGSCPSRTGSPPATGSSSSRRRTATSSLASAPGCPGSTCRRTRPPARTSRTRTSRSSRGSATAGCRRR